MVGAGGASKPTKERAQRGSLGLPSGISKKGKKFQARLSYVPPGCKNKEQRNVGSFDTCEEAEAALAAAQHKLNEGGAAAVWQNEKPQREARGSVCKRAPRACALSFAASAACLLSGAQVIHPEKKPKQEPKHVVKMPGVGRGNNPASHTALKPRKTNAQDENDPVPQYTVMPASIN